jgi:hypothetical protein
MKPSSFRRMHFSRARKAAYFQTLIKARFFVLRLFRALQCAFLRQIYFCIAAAKKAHHAPFRPKIIIDKPVTVCRPRRRL